MRQYKASARRLVGCALLGVVAHPPFRGHPVTPPRIMHSHSVLRKVSWKRSAEVFIGSNGRPSRSLASVFFFCLAKNDTFSRDVMLRKCDVKVHIFRCIYSIEYSRTVVAFKLTMMTRNSLDCTRNLYPVGRNPGSPHETGRDMWQFRCVDPLVQANRREKLVLFAIVVKGICRQEKT